MVQLVEALYHWTCFPSSTIWY